MMRTVSWLTLAGAALLGGCVAGPSPIIATPPPEIPGQFAYADPDGVAGDLAALMPADDPAYQALSAAALANAPTLAQAMARIDQARAAADRAGADRLPTVSASANVTGTRTNPNQFSSNLPPGINFDTERVSYGSNIIAGWDADLFGRLRAQQRAADARLDAATHSAHGVRIALLADIASAVIDLRTLDARATILRRDLSMAEEIRRLTAVRAAAGLIAQAEVVRASAAVNAARARLAALGNDRSRTIGRLVTLSASDAAGIETALTRPALVAAPTAPPVSVPSALLLNRPDIAAAEASLRAADADLAATARRRFPTLSLSGTLGLLAYGLGDLFDADSLIGSLAASVAAPLVDFGRIEADIDGAAANKRLAFAAYRGSVFAALGEAEAAYGLVTAADAEAGALADEMADLDRTARLAAERQRAGLASMLAVSEAQRTAFAAGERVMSAGGRARRARVALWLALGGSE